MESATILEKRKVETMAGKKILILDRGDNVDSARYLAHAGNLIYYYAEVDPRVGQEVKDLYAGLGFEQIASCIKVDSWMSCIDDVDAIICLASGFGELTNWLRSKGYKVYGSGSGEILESQEYTGRKVMGACGIAVPESRVCASIPEIMRLMEKMEDGGYVVKAEKGVDGFQTIMGQRGEIIAKLAELKRKLHYKKAPFRVESLIDGTSVNMFGMYNKWGFAGDYIIDWEAADGGVMTCVKDSHVLIKGGLAKIEKALSKYSIKGMVGIKALISRHAQMLYGKRIVAAMKPQSIGLANRIMVDASEAPYITAAEDYDYKKNNMSIVKASGEWGIYANCYVSEGKEVSQDFIDLGTVYRDRDVVLGRVMLDGTQRCWALPGAQRLFSVVGKGMSYNEAVSDLKGNIERVQKLEPEITGYYDMGFKDEILDRIVNFGLSDIKNL